MEIARPPPPSTNRATSVSLYQQTMSLIEKLYALPRFDFYLFPQGLDSFIDNATLIDPVAVIWACFRLGSPFCHLYNQLRPRKRLQVPELPTVAPPYNNTCKKAVYEFVVACKAELQLEETELFTISGLYKDDTNEFVKLMKTISIVVQKIEDMGLFPPPRPLPFSLPSYAASEGSSDNRAKLIAEMLNTERAYTADLEKLQRYKRELEVQNIVPRDSLLQLFANLDELLDFQRRFLLQMEATLSFPTAEQRIGQLFMQNEDAFAVYVPFCGNYQFAIQKATEQAVQLQRVPDMDPLRELPSYLIKPVQRVCKYPLLLNELIKYSDAATYPFMEELRRGLAAIKRVTDSVNEEKRQEENRRMKRDVIERVEDWKGLNVADFGELLLSEKFPMSTGESERDYDLFLFERILLCCKDTTKKRKSKKNAKEDSTTYALKGNIYIERIDSVTNEANPAQQKFQLKVFWRDGMDMESFVLRCRNMEQVKLWQDRLDGLIQAERLRKLSLRETNPYTKSTQLHPDIIRGLGRGLLSVNDDEDELADQRYPQRLDAMRSPTGELPPPMQRSKSIPFNYYPSVAPNKPQYPNEPSETSPSLSAAQLRKSAPAKPRNNNMPSSSEYSSRSLASRARSSSPSRKRMPRESSPPPPVPELPMSPTGMSVNGYERSYGERVRERSRSRPREEIPRMPLPPPPQLPLPDPPGSLLSGISTSRVSESRRPSQSQPSDRGYFDGYDDIYETNSSGSRGRGDYASELPPSPPASVPGSPMTRKANMAPPPPTLAPRSMTSPYPLTQLSAMQANDPYMQPRGELRNQQGTGRKGSNAGFAYSYEPLNRNGAGATRARGISTSSSGISTSTTSYTPPNFPLPPTPASSTVKIAPTRNGTFPPPSSAGTSHSSIVASSISSPMVKVKMHYGTDMFVVAVPARCTFTELQSKMERKVRLCGSAVPEGKKLRMRYRDEDGDYIMINNTEDVSMAFETGRGGKEREKSFVSIWIL
ncbi:hypothetical protein SpCBS45565_g00012 [Spizellomyces sp. 'palustris']|nr:hypothetical protein SpCBS45565_g00012 [Spizellomyces sp. 'palustris']